MAWLTGWSYRKAITISSASLSLTGSLSDFPILVKFTDDTNIGLHALSNGHDIRFTASNGSPAIPYERESFTITDGKASGTFWVKSDVLNTDTTIYIYYGKSDADDGNDIANTWNSHYKGVWHFGTPLSLSCTDSTSYHNDGTNGGAGPTTGKISGAASFGVSSINLGMPSSLQIQNSITLEAWVNPVGTLIGGDSQLGAIISSQYDGSSAGWSMLYDLRTNPDSQTAPPKHIHFQIFGGGTTHTTNVNATISDNTWTHIMATRTANNNAVVYYNGVAQSLTSAAWNGTVNYSGANLYFGFGKGTLRYFNGSVDEVRISDINRDANWAKFQYHNMADNGNLLSLAGEETPPVINNTHVVIDLGNWVEVTYK